MVVAGAASKTGRRPTNEDSHLLCCNWYDSKETKAGLFAVCDGHGGSVIAETVKDSLSKEITRQLLPNRHPRNMSQKDLQNAFSKLEEKLRERWSSSKERWGDDTGSTCTCAVVVDDGERIILGNCGDSRGLLVRKFNDEVVGIESTNDHKPTVESEKQRIELAGGNVINGRVDGCLGVSRAFGDFKYKTEKMFASDQQKVIAVPEVFEFCGSSGDAVVLACDGIFDVLSSEQVAAYVGKEPGDAAKAIVNAAFEAGSNDNLTCIVVLLGASTETVGSTPASVEEPLDAWSDWAPLIEKALARSF